MTKPTYFHPMISEDVAEIQKKLAAQIAKHTGDLNMAESEILELSLHRWENPTPPTSYVLGPNICLIGQGAKQVTLGDERYYYHPGSFLLSALELPIVAQITEATPEKPYLGLTLNLPIDICAELVSNEKLPTSKIPASMCGLSVSALNYSLADAVYRLLCLLDTPEDIPILAPNIMREICYRLLMSEQGPRIRQIILKGSQGHQLARTIEWLKSNFTQNIQVNELAKQAGMSTSTFHHHFRELTAMTPIQYQKRLRLNEARRLMLTENMDAANAAFEVGYESPSQFSREYKGQFGAPPLKDIKSLRTSVA